MSDSPSLPIAPMNSSKLFLAASIVLLVSIILSVTSISGKDKVASNNYKQFEESEVIPIVGAFGPESIAFNPINGDGPYTGVSDGRIIKWDQSQRRWTNFAVTSPARDRCQGLHDHDEIEYICGRPLGLRFNERTGDLYIADAYMGLLAVGLDGGLAEKVATQAHDTPFNFINGLDIDQSDGVVYFTDSSSMYQRKDHIALILSGDKTGRLLKYDPCSKKTTVVFNNLTFPNGVALSKNGDFILVTETTTCRILKLWLDSSKTVKKVEAIAKVPGFPDNIRRNQKGEFWVAIHSRETIISKWALSKPRVGDFLVKLPFSITKLFSYLTSLREVGLAVRLSEDGEILEILEDKYGKKWKFASEVHERNGYLWIGSVQVPFIFKRKLM